MKNPYTVRVEFRFETGGETYALIPAGEDLIVEDARKNGQEDTHCSGVLELVNGRWQFCEDENGEMFETYMSGRQPILEYLREFGDPRSYSGVEEA